MEHLQLLAGPPEDVEVDISSLAAGKGNYLAFPFVYVDPLLRQHDLPLTRDACLDDEQTLDLVDHRSVLVG